MCGPSQQEKDISASQQKMYDTLSSNYATTFGQQQQITSALTNMFTPILNAGPGQTGMSPGQENALRTQSDSDLSTNFDQARRATAQILAARGGGNTLLPDSTSANITAAGANAEAQARSNAQLGITKQNYAQGYQNWQSAVGALTNTANVINPLGYAGQSTGAGQAASSTAQAMAAQSNSIWNAAIGALGGIGGAALGNPTGLMSMFSKSIPSGGNTSDINPAFAASNALKNLPLPPVYTGAGMTGPVPYTGG